MPYFNIDTNQTLDENTSQNIIAKASALIAGLLGKPESYVMVSIRPQTQMTFAGTPAPTAFGTLKSIGLAPDRCPEFSEKICTFIEEELGVSRDRVYIDFQDLKRNLFGWNGHTF